MAAMVRNECCGHRGWAELHGGGLVHEKGLKASTVIHVEGLHVALAAMAAVAGLMVGSWAVPWTAVVAAIAMAAVAGIMAGAWEVPWAVP